MASSLTEFVASVPTIRWDKETVQGALDATDRAKRDAAQGVPSNDAVQCLFIDDVQQAVKDVAKEARRAVENHLGSILDQCRAIAGAPGDMHKTRDDALAGMHSEVYDGISVVSPLADRAKNAQREYTEFTIEQGLVGMAADPKSRRVLWIILVSALFELLVNGWTLGTAHPSGFVGVLSEILLFTVINMVLGLLGGTAMRGTNYRPRNSFPCIRAWIAVGLCVIAVLMVTFIFGHYRDALVGLQSRIVDGDYESFVRLWATLFQTALVTAFSSDWIPQTMQTVVLIVAGWLISGFVAIEWYRSDDRYPHFGRVTRKRKQAQDQYVCEVKAVNDRILDLANDASQRFAAIEASVLAASQLPDTANSCEAAYTALIAELNSFGKRQLDAYRLASRQAKAWPKSLDSAFEAPAVPSDFAESPNLPVGAVVDERHLEKVSELRLRCDRAVAQARHQYGTRVFAPLPALDPQHPEHNLFANPVATVREIEDSIGKLE